MLLGGFDGGVSQQKLYGSQIGPALQKFHAEGIPEAMGMPVGDAGQTGNSCDGFPSSSHRGGRAAFPGPEEVLRRFHGKSGKGFHGRFGQSDIQRGAGFHHPQQQAAIGTKLDTLQLNGVRDAQTGVEQQKHQGAGSYADSFNGVLVLVVQAVAGVQYFGYFSRGERHCGQAIGERRLELEDLFNPGSIDAERQERAEYLNFRRGLGFLAPGLPVFVHPLKGDAGHRAIEGISDCIEHGAVAFEAGRLECSQLAIRKVESDGLIDFDGLWFLGKGRSIESLLGVLPVAGFERAAGALTVLVVAVAPDRAVTGAVADSLGLKSAIFFMATVKAEHGYRLYIILGTPHGTFEKQRMKHNKDGVFKAVARSERTRTSLESATDKHFSAEQSAQKDTKGPMSVRVGTRLSFPAHQSLTQPEPDNQQKLALNTHGKTGTCSQHGLQPCDGKVHAGISPQASAPSNQDIRPKLGQFANARLNFPAGAQI